MARKYLAFDIETAKDFPAADANWLRHRPLGISCAAALPCNAAEPTVWYGRDAGGKPAKKMSGAEAGQVVTSLVELVSKGYTLLTWNGLGFDLDILAEESGRFEDCRNMAMEHVDMMFHVFCVRGHPVALDKAAQALRISGKPPGMSGVLAPQLWATGEYQQVIDYVSHDVQMTLQVALRCEQKGSFSWITQKGSRSSMDLPRGWLSVASALQLPSPDTSWMNDSIPRKRFTQWMERK